MIYKYNIEYQLNQLNRSWTLKRVKSILKNRHGISERTFDRDRAIKLDDEQDIPAARLEVYAKLFDVKTEELKNYQLEVKSLKEIDFEKQQELVRLKQNLQLS